MALSRLVPRVSHLVGLDHRRPKDPQLSLGVASVAAALRAADIDYTTRSYNVAEPAFCPDKVVGDLMETSNENADLWLGAFVWNEPYIQKITRDLKNRGYKGRIGIAGPQVSYTDASFGLEQAYPAADLFIRGYAENAVVGLAFGDNNVAGAHIAGTPDRGTHGEVDLAALRSPHLDVDLLPPQPFVRWETRRGCAFRCSFCQHREPNAHMRSKKFHEDRISEEIQYFARGPANDIAVLDPTFNTNTFWATKILEDLGEAGFAGKLALQTRPELINVRFLQAVRRLTDLTGANVVLEMGVQTFEPDALRIIERVKGSNPERVVSKVQKNLRLVAEHGVSASVSLIFGLPHQSADSFHRDIDWLTTNVPMLAVEAFPLMLLRGTPLFAQRKNLGLVETVDCADHPLLRNRVQTFIPHVVESPWFTEAEWRDMASTAAGLAD